MALSDEAENSSFMRTYYVFLKTDMRAEIEIKVVCDDLVLSREFCKKMFGAVDDVIRDFKEIEEAGAE